MQFSTQYYIDIIFYKKIEKIKKQNFFKMQAKILRKNAITR